MLSQKVVENFFKRARFRRSKRLRTSMRSSLIKRESKASTSLSAEDGKEEKNNDSMRCKNEKLMIGRDSNICAATTSTAGASISADISNTTGAMMITGATNATEGVIRQFFSTVAPHSLTSQTTDKTTRPQMATTTTTTNDLASSINLTEKEKQKSVQNGNEQTETTNRQPTKTTTSEEKVVEMLRKEVIQLKTELSGSREMLAQMQEREKILRNRLSEQAQRQLQKGSSKFEDLSLGDSRPTQLIKRYGNLYTESRLDAMDALEDVLQMEGCDDLKVKLLLSIIVLAFRSAEKNLLETKTKIRELLNIPRAMESGSSAVRHTAKEMDDTVAVYLRKTVDQYDVSKNYKDVCDCVWMTLYDYPTLKECPGLLRYIEECARISWALTVQNPPFVIDYESKTYNPDTHSRFHTSDADSHVIKSILWPMLTEGERGPCVSKGVIRT